MREQFDDYEKRIMEEIDREAEDIQRALEKCPQALEAKADKTLDQKIYAGIEAYENAVARRKNSEESANAGDADMEDKALAALSEEDREALRLGRELQARRRGKSGKTAQKRMGMGKYIRHIVAAVVILVVVTGAGVKSIGGPERIVEIVKTTFGGRGASRVNSSKDITKSTEDSEEEQAYQQIKDELGIDPVKVFPVLEDMRYKYCEVDSGIRIAQILYEYGDKNISYVIDASYTSETWGIDIEDEKTDEYIYTKNKQEMQITEYELPESGEKEYMAKFEYEGIYYQLVAVMEKKNFEEILENLHFPS